LQGAVPIIIGPGPGFGISISRPSLYGGGLYLGGPPIYSSPYGYPGRVITYTLTPSSNQPIVVSPRITININNPAPAAATDLRDEDHPDKIIIRPGQKAQRGGAAAPGVEQIPAPQPNPIDEAKNFRPIPPNKGDMPKPPQPEMVEPPLGKLAFGDREYARAEHRFQQATQLAPQDAIGYFHLAQAQFALGKYREAVASIHAGLRLKPTWPVSGFRIRALYGQHIDAYAEHLRLLEDAVARRKDDPALLFLLAYQLWFDGRQDEARPLFQRALPLVTEPAFIQLFLKMQPGGPLAFK
jgi:tetratricopeptide (TPR) repeat protein